MFNHLQSFPPEKHAHCFLIKLYRHLLLENCLLFIKVENLLIVTYMCLSEYLVNLSVCLSVCLTLCINLHYKLYKILLYLKKSFPDSYGNYDIAWERSQKEVRIFKNVTKKFVRSLPSKTILCVTV